MGLQVTAALESLDKAGICAGSREHPESQAVAEQARRSRCGLTQTVTPTRLGLAAGTFTFGPRRL